MLFKLSLKNMQRSFKDYTIYFMTLVLGVSIFYIFNSIDQQSAMMQLTSSKEEMVHAMVQIISMISIFVALIFGYLIIYANNFMLRRRKSEMGLYQTLGMSKQKVLFLLLIETIIIGCISLVIGLIIGVFLSQGLSVIIANMFEADMKKFQFCISWAAVSKTVLSFGIIFVVVFFFNILVVTRYKMIDLMNASKKNEVLKVRNPIISTIMFVISIAFIGTSYYMLKETDVLLNIGKEFGIMILFGFVGTLLFFMSLAGFLLKLVQSNKSLYYKNLNMFVLRQLNSKINTTTISITLISIMLLLTIGILSCSLSMVNAFNSDIEENNLTDASFLNYSYDKEEETMDKRFESLGIDLNKYFNNYEVYNVYCNTEGTYSKLLGSELDSFTQNEKINQNYFTNVPFGIMFESEFNKLMELYGEEDWKISLKDQQYAIVCNYESMEKYYNKALKYSQGLVIDGKEFIPYQTSCIEVALSNSNINSEIGTVILKDGAIGNLEVDHEVMCANYLTSDEKKMDQYETKLLEAVSNAQKKQEKSSEFVYDVSFTKLSMKASAVGLRLMLTFIGLYLGFIFSIVSAAVLAIGQLSEAADNKKRYTILRKLGVEDQMIHRSLFIQIGIYFMLPLAVAIVHSIVGISEFGEVLKMFGNLNLTKNILITAAFLVIVYGGYFLLTYFASKTIVREQDNKRTIE